MTEFDSLLENGEIMKPIYEDDNIQIRHVADSAVPGLYAIKPLLSKESVVELSETEFASLTYMQRQIRLGLKSIFNLKLCGLYFEEHPGKRVTSYTIPFHIDRLEERFSVGVYQPYIEEYLKSYSFSSSHQQINIINAGMKEMLSSPNVRKDIEKIKKGIIRVTKPDVHETRILEKTHEAEEVLEVFDEGELPTAPKGKKYFVCIGGTKNFQCFLSDSSVSRGEFILTHEDEVDDCLKPVYSDSQIIVRQDAKYAIPGFYIVSPKSSHYRSIDEMPQDLFEKCMFMARDIKRGLMTLGFDRTHVYNDEKYNSPASVHFWVLPLHDGFIKEHHLNPTIYSKDIWTYLDIFPRYSETRPQILEFNERMKHYLSAKHPT